MPLMAHSCYELRGREGRRCVCLCVCIRTRYNKWFREQTWLGDTHNADQIHPDQAEAFLSTDYVENLAILRQFNNRTGQMCV